jgi:uncharacterized repeat protein (TIGR03806 family)
VTRAAAALVALGLVACGDGGDPCSIPGDGPGVDPARFCDQLASYRLFDDLATQEVAAGLVPYDLNTPLFSDYAGKERWIWLPPGTAMTWSDGDAFGMPAGAVIVKTFSYAHDRRDPGLGRRLLETRLLIRDAASWRGASYVYGEDGTDATLAIAGATLDTSWIHDDGEPRTNRYAVPNKNQCKECHGEHDDVLDALGPKARHLNRSGLDGQNQLQALIDRGALTGAPPPAQWPRAAVATDPSTGTIDERARAWLDINCGNCHNERGGMARTSGLYLDITQTDPAALGVCKAPIAAGRGSGDRKYGIVPGQPDASILMFRIESTESEIKMPELGRNLVDAEGVAVIREWISQLPGSCGG